MPALSLAPSHSCRHICKPRSCTFRASRHSSLRPRAAGPAGAAQALPAAADAVVVGGGLAGLACTVNLRKNGVNAILLEGSDDIGGRTRTDNVDGFLLDRGFQIFLTAYPEAQQQLDLPRLSLQPFYAGARVWYAGTFHLVADPFRHMVDGLQSLPNPIGSVPDKLRVGLFRVKTLLLAGPDAALAGPEETTLECLKAEGFSDAMIDRFFRPFLGGIFFDSSLSVSSRLFRYVMRMLATGSNCLPAAGIGAMAHQLAERLPPGAVHTGVKVQQVLPGSSSASPSVLLSNGATISAAKGVVVAVEGPEAQRLLGSALEASPSKPSPGVGTCNLYFEAARPPRPENMLYLNGSGKGLVNNCCFPSTVAPSYAPPGKTLVSVSTLGTLDSLSDAELEAAVRSELTAWFGAQHVDGWRHLRTYRIPYAQPGQSPPTDFSRPPSLGSGLYVCGDHRSASTFDAVLKSGRLAAEALLAESRSAPVARVQDMAGVGS